MDKKEVLKTIKALFTSNEVEKVDEVVEESFLDVKTLEGRILRVDDMLVNSVIKEVTEDGIVDLEDGEYELEDGLKITVAEGVITDLVEPEVVEEVTDEEVEEVFETEETEETETEEVFEEEEKEEEKVEEELEDEESELTELLELVKGMVDGMETMKKDLELMKEENEELKSRFNTFAEQPSVEKTSTKVDFNKVSRDERLKFLSKK